MAITLSGTYPAPRVDTTDPAGYPGGAFKNETAPGADDGTPNEVDWANDFLGFFQELLDRASIAASGTPDKVGTSDYNDALDALYQQLISGGVVGNLTTIGAGGQVVDSGTSLDALDALYQQLISGGVVGNLTTIGAGGQVVDSGTSLSDVLASLSPQGAWNASTNTPTLPGSAATGDFWIVSVAGSTSLGGITDWGVNDWAVKTATGWAKIDNSEALTAVEVAGIQASPTPITAANPAASQADLVTPTRKELHLTEEYASGTTGAALTDSAFAKRLLNTSKLNTLTGTGFLLSSGQVTLPAGTYRGYAKGVLYSSRATYVHQLALEDVDNTTTIDYGISSRTGGEINDHTCDEATVRIDPFTIAIPTIFELQHYAKKIVDPVGAIGSFGYQVTSGNPEQYAELYLEQD